MSVICHEVSLLTSDITHIKHQTPHIRYTYITHQTWHQTSYIYHMRRLTYDIRHVKSDIWDQTSDIRYLTSDIRCLTWDNRRLPSVVWDVNIRHQTFDIRHLTSDEDINGLTSYIIYHTLEVWDKTRDIRHQTPDIRHMTFGIRHNTSDFWWQMSVICHEVRRLTSVITHFTYQTSHIRHTYITHQTSDIRHHIYIYIYHIWDSLHMTSDMWHRRLRSDVWHQSSEIRLLTTEIRRLRSDV